MSEKNENFQLGKNELMEHLGIVSVLFKEFDLVNFINKLLPFNHKKVSMGERALAMCLNALGFVDRPLYLTPHFLEHLHLTRLIGPDLKPEFFNDDALAELLDQIATFGSENFFGAVSAHVLKKLNVVPTEFTLDSTSVSTYARRPQKKDDEVIETEDNLAFFLLQKGYSKQHRPDLNQFILNLVLTGAQGLPCAINVLPGDSSDKTSFLESIQQVSSSIKENFSLEEQAIWIADSALYSKELLNLAHKLTFKWITRVPHTNSPIKQELQIAAEKTDWHKYPLNDNYQYYETDMDFNGENHRLIVLKSETLKASKLKTFEKNLLKKEKAVMKKVFSLEGKIFSCEADAQKAFDELKTSEDLFLLSIENIEKIEQYEKPGRPKKGEKKISKGFCLQIKVEPDEKAIEIERSKLGIFALGTNLSSKTHSTEQVLQSYKKLNKNEQGFRFLKAPYFFCDHIYLKNEKRIQALMSIMCLALLLFGVFEWKIREKCAEEDLEIPNHDKKKTKKPTARLCFSHFRGIGVMIVKGKKPFKVFSELNKVVQTILHLLGPPYVQIYQPY